MGEEKDASLLLPLAIRQSLGHAMSTSKRRFFINRLLLILVAAVVLFCLAVSTSSWTQAQEAVNTDVFITDVQKQQSAALGATEPSPPSSSTASKTSPSPLFHPATTMKSETGPHQLHFRQPPNSVVVVRAGGDVQLDCRPSEGIKGKFHKVMWYKDDISLLYSTIKNEYRSSDIDKRISTSVDVQDLNWALRIRNVTMADAGSYLCYKITRSSRDFITFQLDIIPMDDDTTLLPQRSASSIGDKLLSGYVVTPNVCPNEGRDIDMLVILASHPLYVSSRDRVRHTWGTLADKSITVVFGLGDISKTLGDKIKVEAEKNNDIVYGKFHDVNIDPYTESVKRLSMLKWVVDYCRFAKFTMIATHNEFINLLLLKKLVKDINPEDPAVYGLVEGNTTVTRDPNDPLYLSYTAYQRKKLPSFITRPAFLVSRAAVGSLTEAVLETNAISHYDMLITGVAAENGNIKRIHMPELYKTNQRIESCEFDKFAVGSSWGEPLDKKVTKKIASGKACETPK